MTEDHDAHQQQHHFSSLSAAPLQIRSNSLFSAIDPDDFGRAPIETVVDYLESANGFSGVYRILTTDTTGGFVLQVNSNSIHFWNFNESILFEISRFPKLR